MKVTVVGAGNVGATCANVIALKGFASELVLLDIKEGISEGKAMDMMQTSHMMGFDTTMIGCTNDYSKTADSAVVIITSGIPRKPGMTREELIGTNAGIVKSVVDQILKYSPNAIFVIISNPMDTMTYLALKASGVPKNRIVGMGGMLDSSRFRYYISQALGCTPTDVDGMVIGGHGDTTMIPLIRFATYKGIPVTELLDKETLDKIAQILKSKNEIAIKLLPSYEENTEGYAQQKQNYLAKKDDDRNLKPEEIEALILKEKIKIPNLEKIAKNRIINISNYLVKEKGINPKQIVMTDKIENNSSAINLNISKKLSSFIISKLDSFSSNSSLFTTILVVDSG